MPNITFDPEYPEKRGKRGDQRLLIDMWKEHKEENKLRFRYVWNKKEFDKVDPRKVDYLLGKSMKITFKITYKLKVSTLLPTEHARHLPRTPRFHGSKKFLGLNSNFIKIHFIIIKIFT